MRALRAVVRFVRSEPAILTTVAADALSFGADFGLHLSAAQQRDVFAVASALTALVIRQSVTPNVRSASTVQRVAALEAAVAELATSGSPKISA